MKVVCIHNSNTILELNKVYDVIKDGLAYMIIDDAGDIMPYAANRFITLDEYRNRKLNEIGI